MSHVSVRCDDFRINLRLIEDVATKAEPVFAGAIVFRDTTGKSGLCEEDEWLCGDHGSHFVFRRQRGGGGVFSLYRRTLTFTNPL
ncbi:Hypothetical protein SMAX5B_015611 [Scophthalmus maximus]|uniref:Uncharacterized protein n=1 Tax=Scophthalmus maximus TaxID=52904 RepID=A0A2U9CYU9_SCOMX|nr:Hypothetical protein SMAX5B_015611 [Scophthalmus maximus]